MGRDLSSNDFGRFLASVEERDIDLLLMEEFQISDEFVAWFCSNLDLQEVQPAGAWHSVSDTDGETDLLLRVIVGGQRIGVLIENKINAPEQIRQAERYHIRGVRSREAGKFEDYLTVISAPQRYLDGLSSDSIYHHRVSYEAIAEWFNRSKDRRAAWRRQIMLEAIEQGRRGYTMVVSTTNTAFHMQYWEHLQGKHPRIKMQRPQNKGSKSNWIIMKGLDFPPGVKLHHKVDQQVVELGFESRHVDEILSLQLQLPDEILVVQKGKTASLMVKVPPMDMTKGISPQVAALEEVLQAAYRLMPFARMLSADRKGPYSTRRTAEWPIRQSRLR